MLLDVVAVYDKALGAYCQPSFVASRSVALRSFIDMVNKPGSDIGAHAEDYSLCALCQYDDSTGEFIPLNDGDVELITQASDCLNKQ